MKSFVTKCLLFSVLLLSSLGMLTVLSAFISSQFFSYELPQQTKTIVLGNSHTECAINDQQISSVVNLAQSGSAYFYDYLKLREITRHNPHIKSVVLSYTYHDLEKEMDQWITGEGKLKFKLRNHFLFFNLKDYFELLKTNTWGVIKFTPQTIFYNINAVLKGYSYIGGYKYLQRDKLEEAIDYNRTRKDLSEGSPKSDYQKKYLKKIYEHCVRENLTLVLLHTPIHPIESEHYEPVTNYYHNFAKSELPDAVLINHADLNLSDDSYADLDHLNYKGASRYTEIIDNSLRSLGVINPHF